MVIIKEPDTDNLIHISTTPSIHETYYIPNESSVQELSNEHYSRRDQTLWCRLV